MQMFRLIFFIICSLGLPTFASAELAAFKSEEEMVEGWYHRHEMASWIRRGGNRLVIEGILKNIANSSGLRRNPELVDTQIEYAPGNWVYEWVQAGDAALAAAQADKKASETSKLNEALTYYTVASWPHLGRDEDKQALEKAREVYLMLTSAEGLRVKHVSFDVLDTSSKGYLHLPEGKGPFPLLIFTYGSDVTKEDGLEIFTHEMRPRGIAVLTVDLPGIGEASHIALTRGSDVVLAGAREFAGTLKNINQDQIFVVGASFGGNAAARYYGNQHPAAGVVSMCGPLHRPFVAPPEVYDALPVLTIDGVKSRLGILGADNTTLAKTTPLLSLKELLTKASKNRTPLLIFTTNNDPVAPLADLPLLHGAAASYDQIIMDQVGHCPARWVRQPVLSRWIRQQISQSDL